MVRALTAAGRLLRAVAALATLAGFVAGVPWLLTASAGWPLGWIGWPQLDHAPGIADVAGALTSPWSDQMILGLLASIGWVLWVMFIRHVVVEVIEASAHAAAARRGQSRPPVTGRGPIRWVAAVLVGAIMGTVLFDTAHALTGPTGAGAAAAADTAARRPAVAVAPALPTVTPAVVDSARLQSLPTGSAPASPRAITLAARQAATDHDRDIPAWARHAPGGVHRVKAGDNLWDLAEAKLDDPHRWREIYTLNRGHEQANGYALTDPDEIHVGWIIAMPARDKGPVASAPADPAPDSAAPADPADEDTSAAEPTTAGDATPVPATPSPSATTAPSSAAPSVEAPASAEPTDSSTPSSDTTAPDSDNETDSQHDRAGINLPSQGWVSLGLAGLIATVASLLRLQRRRRARLTFPISTRISPQPAPVPEPLVPVGAIGARHPRTGNDQQHTPPIPAVPVPIGLDAGGAEVSLFDLPGPGLAVDGPGAESAARAVLAAALATGATQTAVARPVVVTTIEILARLLPDGARLVGLDPDNTSYDGERLIVLSDAAAAVTHAEEEMILRRRLLDTFDVDTIAALNARTDHAEAQPPYVLLVEATSRHAARLLAVGTQRAVLHLHPVVLGTVEGVPAVEVAADGTTSGDEAAGLARLSTLAADDLTAVLAMLTDATARPEAGHDIDLDPVGRDDIAASTKANAEAAERVPAQPRDAAAPVRLRVLGPVMVETEAGPVATGMRSGSYIVLASLAVHPSGRTLDQLAGDLHPDTDPSTAGKRIRTDISTIRRVLRTTTANTEAMFVVYDPATGRYRLDSELITVDLWQMLTAIETANTADDDAQVLTLLRQAVELYGGDFADGADQTWITDYATTYRHQILSAFARIAEITEADHPDQAVAALERALEFDPVNEELYQRVMRIHGRQQRPDAVRRTLRRLEERLADLGDAEPSEATRRVAERQLRPATTGVRR